MLQSILLLLAASSTTAQAAPMRFPDGTVDIAVLFDGDATSNQALLEPMQESIRSLAEPDFKIAFPPALTRTSDFTQAGVQRDLDALIADPKTDLVLTVGLLGSHLAAIGSAPAKPVFAPLVFDAQAQGVPHTATGTGVRNLNYLALPSTISGDLASLQDVTPFRRATVLLAGPLEAAMPPGWQQALAERAAPGVTVDVVSAGDTAAAILGALPPDAEMVFIAPLPSLPAAERDQLLTALKERKLPSFAMWGADWTDRGALAARPAESVLPTLARRLAINVLHTLEGDNPSTQAVTVDSRPGLVINQDTAAAIQRSPGWDALAESQPPAATTTSGMTMAEAAAEAVAANPDVIAGQRQVEAGEAQVDFARSPLLPDITLGANGMIIDPNTSAMAGGLFAQYQVQATASARQILLSEDAFSDLDVQSRTQEATVAQQVSLEADTIQQAALTFLRVLRFRAVEALESNNLTITRKNLDLAAVRARVGSAQPTEVYRWEVEVSGDQQRVLSAYSQRVSAEYDFNRVLNRPQDAPVRLDDTLDLEGGGTVQRYSANPATFAVLADYTVQDGLERTPDLQAIDRQIEAQDRATKAAKRAWYMPVVGLQGDLIYRILRTGNGTENSAPVKLAPFMWQVGADASWPLTNGGARIAEVGVNSAEIERLRSQRTATSQRIEHRIRSALITVATNARAVAIAERGAEAAHRNLDAVTTSYSLGAVSIIDLLDAQNSALTADLSHLDSRYTLRESLIELGRSTYRFDFLETEQSAAEWEAGLRERLSQAGLPVPDETTPPPDAP